MESMNLQSVCPTITLDSQGIWVAQTSSSISYPDDGNDFCFELEDCTYWFSHRNVLIHGLYEKHAKSAPLFDIGGGNGAVSKYLSDRGVPCVLVEPGRSGALNAKRRGVSHVVQSTLQDAGFLSDAIDHVGLFDVIEHIEDDYAFLGDLCSYQKAGSYAFLTVPSLGFLWSKEDVTAGHFRRYTKKTLSSLLRRTGYEVCQCSYFFTFLVLPVFAFRTLPSLIGLRDAPSVDSAKREHTSSSKTVSAILNRFTGFESTWIQSGRSLPVGSSLIAVARKK
jgi:hypothetical protein